MSVGRIVGKPETIQKRSQRKFVGFIGSDAQLMNGRDDVKTDGSRQFLHVTTEMLDTLNLWKQTTQFPMLEDWIFASPAQIGRLPWSYDQVWRVYQKAGAEAGIGGLGTHSLRHTYRSWLDAVGAPLAVQQKMMRHADIRTTMNI